MNTSIQNARIVSQSLLNEVKYSNYVSKLFFKGKWTRSQSLLNEVKYSNEKKLVEHILGMFSVAIPFKWGQVFQLEDKEIVKKELIIESQSLLNEVKYSNMQTLKLRA